MQWMQLDQNGDANSWSLGEFLAQDEVRVMMLDPACTTSRSHSVSSSTGDCDLELRQLDWCAEDDGSLDDIPSSTDAFTAAGPGPSIAASDWLPQVTPYLSSLGTEPTEPSRTPAASRAAPRSPAETGSARV